MVTFLNSLFNFKRRTQTTQEQVNQAVANALAYIGPKVPTYPDIDQRKAITDGFLGNTDIYTIISRKAAMCAAIPFYEYRIKGEEGKKYLQEYKQLMSSPVSPSKAEETMFKAQRLKLKALEQIDTGSDLNRLLTTPNSEQSQMELMEMAYAYLCLTGNAYLGKLRLNAGANQGKVQELFSLPSQYMKIIPDGRFPLGISSYEYYLYSPLPIEKNDVVHLKYFNPDVQSNGSHLYGLSPIRANKKLLTRSNSEMDSTVSQYENGGPPVIVYNEELKGPEGLAMGKAVKKGYHDEMAGNKNRGKIFFAAGKLGILQTGISPADLKILESSTITFRKLAAVWGMPSALFNDNEHTTLANMNEFQKLAYTHGCIPDVIRMRDALNRCMLPDFNLVGTSYIDADFTNISALQPDMKTLSEWLDMSPEITYNERREMKKLDRLNDPNMDKIYVPNNLVPLEDLNMPAPDNIQTTVDQLNKSGLNPYKD
ncbi:hypothetical protein DCC81_24725 [Chitinophaga parva]|uniref:Phage portal protein n=1 Tax=Chitinophaga parva TaxID=2169414 RepID=A0A2T7BBM6_9BACT|nr:phage portal protein [Chitinophaga parva]PUZ21795.1 hypothetical protein DCC81_24725 [Chitinophaga parva]